MRGVLQWSDALRRTQRQVVLVVSQSVSGNAVAVDGELTKMVVNRQGQKKMTQLTWKSTAPVGEGYFFCRINSCFSWGFLCCVNVFLEQNPDVEGCG